jgi:UDP-glucose 4-epimerase
VNQTGSIVVFDTARALGQLTGQAMPVVYASSAAVYGDSGMSGMLREDLRSQPLSAYGADKRGSELHAQVAFSVHGVPTLGLRFFNVYGPRQDPLSPYSGVISIFARLAAEGAVLTVHGDGSQTRDFVFVSDVVAHLQQSMDVLHRTPMTKVLNVCTGRGTSVLALAQALADAGGTGRAKIVHGEERTGDVRHSIGDPSAAIALLGLRAEVTLEDGLKQTLSSLTVVLVPELSR